MSINAIKQILLSITVIFFLASCNSTKKIASNNPRETTSYSTTPNSSIRTNVESFSKTCKGTRYKYAGKDKNGFDCSGFTSYVFKKYNVNLSSSSSAQAQQGRKIPVNQSKKGDLIFFGTAGKVSHVAIVLSNTGEGITVIHSTSSKGVIVQNVSKSSYWKPRILFARDVISR